MKPPWEKYKKMLWQQAIHREKMIATSTHCSTPNYLEHESKDFNKNYATFSKIFDEQWNNYDVDMWQKIAIAMVADVKFEHINKNDSNFFGKQWLEETGR